MFLFSNTNIIIKVLQVARGRRKTSPLKKKKMLGKHCLEKPSLYHHIFISIFCVGRYLEHQRPYRFAFTA